VSAWGTANETAALRRVLLRHPRDAWRSQRRLAGAWRDLHYLAEPEVSRAVEQYEAFLAAVAGCGAEVEWLEGGDGGPDSVYVHDPLVMTPKGAILGRMGKAARGEEPAAMEPRLEQLGVPVLGRIEPPGLLEGGDVVWFDPRTLAVGEGYRTNASGIAQLRAILEGRVTVIPVPLPHWTGPGDCLHLMSILSPVDDDLMVVHSRLMAAPFREWLLARGARLVEVPVEEWDTLGTNVLALGPRRCVMLDGNPRTRAALEAAGAEVLTFPGSEICLKGCGGPTCLARPLLRR
jgi:N-dimethylarginine dimethylaminohydrolase